MSQPLHSRASTAGQHVVIATLFAASLCFTACKPAVPKTDTSALDQAGMYFNSITALQAMKISNAEIAELAIARNAGLSDDTCIQLVKLARSRQQPFSDGQSIANLLMAGMSEQSTLQLAKLNQLGLWAGEAQIMRLAGLSDKVILAVAQRRTQGLPVLSGKKLADLKNVNVSDATILDMVQKGVSEADVSYYIAARQNAAGGHSFVYQGRGRRR